MKKNEVICWGVQLLVENANDLELLTPILEKAEVMDHFVGIYPIQTKPFSGGILLFDDLYSRNLAFLKLKSYNSLLVQVTANFRPAYVDENKLKRRTA